MKFLKRYLNALPMYFTAHRLPVLPTNRRGKRLRRAIRTAPFSLPQFPTHPCTRGKPVGPLPSDEFFRFYYIIKTARCKAFHFYFMLLFPIHTSPQCRQKTARGALPPCGCAPLPAPIYFFCIPARFARAAHDAFLPLQSNPAPCRISRVFASSLSRPCFRCARSAPAKRRSLRPPRSASYPENSAA